MSRDVKRTFFVFAQYLLAMCSQNSERFARFFRFFLDLHRRPRAGRKKRAYHRFARGVGRDSCHTGDIEVGVIIVLLLTIACVSNIALKIKRGDDLFAASFSGLKPWLLLIRFETKGRIG